MLPIQRHMILKLVDQRSDQETDVSQTAFDHTDRGGGGHQRLAFTQLDHRPLVAQHHVAGRARRQSVGDLDINHLVFHPR